VAADVGSLLGDLDRPERVTAGLVDPGRLDRVAGARGLEACCGVAEGPGVGAAGGHDDEEGAVEEKSTPRM
jgi:hypothetical protein